MASLREAIERGEALSPRFPPCAECGGDGECRIRHAPPRGRAARHLSDGFGPSKRPWMIISGLLDRKVRRGSFVMGSLRFLLALAVAGGHAASMFGFAATWIFPGREAVQIFYMISGFLVAMIL